jgi:hypothetical protein
MTFLKRCCAIVIGVYLYGYRTDSTLISCWINEVSSTDFKQNNSHFYFDSSFFCMTKTSFWLFGWLVGWFRAVKKYIPNRYTRLIRQIMRDVENDDNHFELLQKQIGTLLNNAKYNLNLSILHLLWMEFVIFLSKYLFSLKGTRMSCLY